MAPAEKHDHERSNTPEDGAERSRRVLGFGQLARRIADWTTKCILSGLILVLGLGFGRQVLDWWKPNDGDKTVVPPSSVPPDQFGDPALPHTLQFGSHRWSMTQQSAQGTTQQALAVLRQRCRESTRKSVWPADDAGTSEQQLLRSLAQRAPVEEDPGKWRLHVLEGAFPMIAGVRLAEAGQSGPDPSAVALPASRVVTWGMAVPKGEQSWVLYVFHPAASALGSVVRIADLSLPPDCSMTFSMEAGGSAVVAFRGPEQVETWKGFFEAELAVRGWTAAGDWRQHGPMWQRHWIKPEEDSERQSREMNLQFGSDRHGGLTGLILVTPKTK